MRKELLQFLSFAKFLKDALGERYHVALVDAEEPDRELAVSEGSISREGAGELPGAEILSDILNSRELKKLDYLCSFSDTEKDTQGQKNSVYYIRDEAGSIAGFLCIYEKRGDLYKVKDVLDQILSTDEQTAKGSERIEAEVNSLLRERIVEVLERHRTENKKMTKADKIDFISELFEMGIFRMKGAAAQVSEVTGISQASIYRYLGEIIEE